MTDLEKIRKLAGWSRDKAAVEARVAYATARAFELGGPSAINDAGCRDRLVAVYEQLHFRARVKENIAKMRAG